MGNMDDYINLSVQAKQSGGPEALVEALIKKGAAQGFGKGSLVTTAAIAGVAGAIFGGKYLWEGYAKTLTKGESDAAAAAIAKADQRGWNTVHTTREVEGGLTLTAGDRFKALTRDGDVVMIEVDACDDNPFFVSGTVLKDISDFLLEELDD